MLVKQIIQAVGLSLPAAGNVSRRNMRRQSRTFFTAAGFAVLFLLLPSSALSHGPLELWIHPYLPSTEITERFTPLASYLEERLGIKIFIRVSRDYNDHIEHVGVGRTSIAYMGPTSYVKLVDRYGPQNILSGLEVNGSHTFHGVIVAHTDSAFKDLGDLKGKSFAFGDPDSTMSHYLPRYMLQKAGVPIENLKRYQHLRSHQDVALAVIGGYFDAGGIMEEVFESYRGRGLKILEKSPAIPEHLFVAGKDMEPEMSRALRGALLELKAGSKNLEILASIKSNATGLGSTADSDYDILRTILKGLGMQEGHK